MSANKHSIIIYPIVFLLVLAIFTAWINYAVQPPKAKPDGSSRHDPDYIMSNFVTTQTDINGALRYKLAAVEMKHFPDDDTTALQRPRFTQFAVGKPYTQVEGLHGLVSGNGEQIQLMDKVKVTRQAFADKGEMTVETEYLNILPNQDLVHTDKPVVIRQAPKTVIYATGMIYDKNKQTVTLLHKVRAHYERPATTAGGVKTPAGQKQTALNKPGNAKSGSVKPNANKSNTVKSDTTKSNTTDTRIRRRYE
ncbi:MAG: LPS export ABC transporter periplasmic protein LptC [Betaproteobacteria bacterium HGW-Betaproteobacteria-20]|nr:MAG: LPS export ABC transporter periplasmic protein LptC [Betaproteobacteria bacterium HGW-Betaproteobacteria-20]